MSWQKFGVLSDGSLCSLSCSLLEFLSALSKHALIASITHSCESKKKFFFSLQPAMTKPRPKGSYWVNVVLRRNFKWLRSKNVNDTYYKMVRSAGLACFKLYHSCGKGSFVFHSGPHGVRLDNDSLAMFCSGDLQRCKFHRSHFNTLSFTPLCAVGEEHQETVNHGCRKTYREHVGAVVKLSEKIQTLWHTFFPPMSQTPHLCFFDYITRPICHCQRQFFFHDKTASEYGLNLWSQRDPSTTKTLSFVHRQKTFL